MPRERKNAPAQTQSPTRERVGRPEPAARTRQRGAEGEPEIDLTDEELRSLADEGVDPEEVLEVARAKEDSDEVSIFDRDSARDDLEGLIGDDERE